MLTRSLARAIGGVCIATVATASAAHLAAAGAGQSAKGPSVNSLYDLKVASLDGKPADLGSYRGKVALVVNVASKCGYTPQYEGLEALHKELAPKGVVVLGFPSNDFGGQEPGTAQQIAEFCRLTYGVTFPMFSKVVTRPGPDQSPVYAFLGKDGQLPEWNFGKYVVGKDGQMVAFFPSRVRPDSKELRDTIARALSAN